MSAPGIVNMLNPLEEQTNVDKRADGYLKYFRDKNAKNCRELEDKRKHNTVDMVHRYYDLTTDFYEYGWGDNFHFYGQSRGESRETAIKKHHYRLAIKLNIRPGEAVLDMGCGIGGPARSIAQICECKITGININDYQLRRARYLTEKAGLSHLCQFQTADFINTGFESESFSKIFAIESTCHAADKTKVYGEAFRLLEKGGLFAFYEWLMTDKYNPNDEGHKKIKEGIMEGDGLPDIEMIRDCRRAVREVGFEIVEACDLAPKCDIPWWYSLSPSWSITDFKATPLGRWMTHMSLMTLETIGIVPKGSTKVHKMLRLAADSLVKGGKEEIFTPMYFVLARKPLNNKNA